MPPLDVMHIGASLVLKTVKAIETNAIELKEQDSFIQTGEVLQHAPKIFRDDCRLDFSKSSAELFNQVRGLSPYPGAFFEMQLPSGEINMIKVLKAEWELEPVFMSHHLTSDNKKLIKISTKDGFLVLKEIQWPGKKRMTTEEFLRGHTLPEEFTLL